MSNHPELRQEIEATRQAFHQLLAQVPETAFFQPSDNPAWTVGEVLYHISLAPRFLLQDVKMITGQSWFLRFVPILMPKWLFNWLNARLTRYGARNLTRQFLADEYDKAHAITVKALDSVTEADLTKSLHYPNWDPLLSGEVTLERLFHYVKVHFDSHAVQIRAMIDQPVSSR